MSAWTCSPSLLLSSFLFIFLIHWIFFGFHFAVLVVNWSKVLGIDHIRE